MIIVKEFKARLTTFVHIQCCLECPRSYHLTCFPPCTRYNELSLLCHEHAASNKLPEIDKESSMQIAIESQIGKERLNVDKHQLQLGKQRLNPFFLSLSGEHHTATESKFAEHAEQQGQDVPELSYCLPVSFKNVVYAAYPPYRRIQANQVDPNHAPPRVEVGDECNCEVTCGDTCLNREVSRECCEGNCRVGQKCGNRAMGKRIVPKCKVQRETGKGWGLLTLENVKEGALVQEYIGEIVDEEEKGRRLTAWSIAHPNDPNFYVMENVSGWYIDARLMSNNSRFINHSCDPNCMVRCVSVGGVERNGIYATRDIEAGEFLSYDYRFETIESEKFTCRCGAESCRGTLKYGGKSSSEAQVTVKTKTQVWDEAKAGYDRDKKLVEDYTQEGSVVSLVSAAVPGCLSNDQLVANGPYLQNCNVRPPFLRRNAVLGSNFVTKSFRFDRDL
jgi:hypothetical protein